MPQAHPDRADPAESRGCLRFFYRDWRPTRFGRLWSRALASLTARGLLPSLLTSLQVSNRHTGQLESTVLVLASHDGHRYLVSMLGNGSEWVANVRAARGQAIMKAGHARPVLLTELPIAERAPILKAWCQVANSGRRHLPVAPDASIEAFAAIAADYPVFRVDLR